MTASKTSGACPVCRQSLREIGRTSYYISRRRADDLLVPVLRCSACHLLVQRVPLEVLDKHFDNASYTDEAREEQAKQRRTSLYPLICDRYLAELGGDGRRLLDVGSSFGHFMAAAQDQGWETIGIESVSRCVDIARSRGLVVAEGDFPEAVPRDAPFDVVTFLDSFYYVADIQEAMRTAWDVLSPPGSVFLRLTNRAWLWRLARARTNDAGLLPGWLIGDALYEFGPKSITMLLQGSGFGSIKLWSEPSSAQEQLGGSRKVLYAVKHAAKIATRDRLKMSPGLFVTAQKG